jgi:hypothetical protein
VRTCYYLVRTFIFCTLLLFVTCAPGRCGFLISEPYTATGFDSRSISGRSVIVLPLLKKQGIDTAGSLSDTSLMRSMCDIRKDLHFVPFRQTIPFIHARYSEMVLPTFLNDLFIGKIPVLQAADSLWGLMNADFMSVIRLTSGHSVRTFKGDIHKKIILEGELWDCRKAEVVVRIVVNGICITPNISDDHFIIDGVKEIVRKFPLSSPAYDTQSW